MVVYAALVSAFLALLWRDRPRERFKLFLQIFLGMVGGGLALGWIMYLAPASPPVIPPP
jgi:hypothetical protein